MTGVRNAGSSLTVKRCYGWMSWFCPECRAQKNWPLSAAEWRAASRLTRNLMPNVQPLYRVQQVVTPCWRLYDCVCNR